MKPNFGEPTQVFDLFEGKNFELVITRQNDYNNYDTSKFSSSKSSIVLGVEGKTAERVEEDMTTIKAELEGAPSLTSFEYRAWDEPTREFVNSVIKMYLNPGDAMDKVTNQTFDKPVAKTAPKAETATTTETTTSGSGESSADLESFLNDLEI